MIYVEEPIPPPNTGLIALCGIDKTEWSISVTVVSEVRVLVLVAKTTGVKLKTIAIATTNAIMNLEVFTRNTTKEEKV